MHGIHGYHHDLLEFFFISIEFGIAEELDK